VTYAEMMKGAAIYSSIFSVLIRCIAEQAQGIFDSVALKQTPKLRAEPYRT